ncbi:MAG: NAD(+) synthase [Bacilli bacterium]|nr:NAD(+) synthase [Bacilli bacterium]
MTKFNAKEETDNIIEFIRNYYQKYSLGGAVLGISGGKDSAVVSALLVKALGKENVVGLTLPCHSIETDKNHAKLISDFYEFRLFDFDLTKIFDQFKTNIDTLYSDLKETDVKNADINLKPRLRMASVYYFAALLTELEKKPYLVIGTSNKCELYVGYFTKGGDSVHDISPIADFTVEEVIEIGKYLQVPNEVLFKAPSDGLSHATDEEKLGVTYKEIASYIEEPERVEESARNKIKIFHQNAFHKFTTPTYKRD